MILKSKRKARLHYVRAPETKEIHYDIETIDMFEKGVPKK